MGISEDLFGREVGRSSHDAAAAGDLRGKPCHAKISKLYLTFWRDENVGGFYIAVNNVGPMREAECRGEVPGPESNAREREGTSGENSFQCFSLDIFHHEIGHTVFVRADVVESDNVGMRETTDNLRLADKLLLKIAGTKTLEKSFQSDCSADKRVASFVDTARGAHTERCDDFVSIVSSVHE